MTNPLRRVVTGLNAQGKSCVISDTTVDQIPGGDSPRAILWRTEGFPVSNAGNDEAARPFDVELLRTSSSLFLMRRTEPGQVLSWHATDTVDYVVIASGGFRLGLEDGSVDVHAGDVVVDRGVIHSWTTLGDQPAMMIAALVRAQPVGTGADYGEVFKRT